MFAQHPYASWPWAGGAWSVIVPGPAVIFWPDEWCPSLAPTRTNTLEVDTVEMGDGYCHRSTRGFNPVAQSWDYQFPFTSLDQLDAMDAFLQRYSAPGFWFVPPENVEAIMVTADEWSASITDRTGRGALVGFLQVTFTRAFNPQSIARIAGLVAP